MIKGVTKSLIAYTLRDHFANKIDILIKKDPKFAIKVDELIDACSVVSNPLESCRIGMTDLWLSHCDDKDE